MRHDLTLTAAAAPGTYAFAVLGPDDGSRGHTACFSVLADEWPRMRSGLRERLGIAG